MRHIRVFPGAPAEEKLQGKLESSRCFGRCNDYLHLQVDGAEPRLLRTVWGDNLADKRQTRPMNKFFIYGIIPRRFFSRRTVNFETAVEVPQAWRKFMIRLTRKCWENEKFVSQNWFSFQIMFVLGSRLLSNVSSRADEILAFVCIVATIIGAGR